MYKIQSVEDQQKFAVPMTRETETLFYNIRMIIDAKVESEPRAWLISKVNRISPNGICRVTLTQDNFDQHNDYVEKDEDGNIVGMWANYFNSNVEPTPVIQDDETAIFSSTISKITCSGRPQLKIGGSAKTFTVRYYDYNDEEILDHVTGSWEFFIDGESLPNNLMNLSYQDNKVKVKFLGDDSYIGKILTIKNTSEDTVSELQIEIIAL